MLQYQYERYKIIGIAAGISIISEIRGNKI